MPRARLTKRQKDFLREVKATGEFFWVNAVDHLNTRTAESLIRRGLLKSEYKKRDGAEPGDHREFEHLTLSPAGEGMLR